MSLVAAPASEAVNYQLNPENPVVESTNGIPGLAVPEGVAIDPASGDVYVAHLTTLGEELEPGTITKLDADGNPGVPISMGSGFFSGVAVGGSTVFGFNAFFQEINSFDFAGNAGTSYGVEGGSVVQIASDPAGNVYVPAASTINKYTSSGEAGTPASIDCSACPAPTTLASPNSVAVNSDNGDIFVADTGNERVVKFDSEGENPSVLASFEEQPLAIAVDPATGNVFVGVGVEGGFHIIVLDPSGEAVGDFGEATFESGYPPGFGTNHLAVSSTTGRVYVTDSAITEAGALSLLYMFDPVPPVASTTAATERTQTTATLNGTVNPNEGGAITSCEFEWGTTTEYTGGTVPCAENPGEGSEAVPVEGGLEGLSPNTTYHYQLVVDNGTGAIAGGDQEFTTLPNAPLAETEAASGISQTKATLNATVDAEGDDASCEFEYGTSVAYGKSAPCSTNPVTGSAATAVSAALSGLSAGTTYHYRVVAENEGGGGEGEDITFATPADTCATNAALCPPPPPPPPPADDEAPYKACLAKAKKAFKRAQKAAKAKKGKARAKAMKAANKAKRKAIKRCKALR